MSISNNVSRNVRVVNTSFVIQNCYYVWYKFVRYWNSFDFVCCAKLNKVRIKISYYFISKNITFFNERLFWDFNSVYIVSKISKSFKYVQIYNIPNVVRYVSAFDSIFRFFKMVNEPIYIVSIVL